MICLKMFEVRLLSCATQRGGVCPEVLQRKVKSVGCPILYCRGEQVKVLLTNRVSAAVVSGGPGDWLWDERVEIGILKLVEVGT